MLVMVAQKGVEGCEVCLSDRSSENCLKTGVRRENTKEKSLY